MPLSVSVIIPARNEASSIEGCVLSVCNNGYPNELVDVWVCDGQSTDGTADLVEKLGTQYSNVYLLENEKRVTPVALNLGIKASAGEVIVILGGHAELLPGFLEENVKILEAHPEVACSGGVIENVYENSISSFIGQAMSSPFGVGNAHFRTGQADGYVDTVAFGAYRRSVLDTIGLFDESLYRNQDDELNFRLLQSGAKIYLSKKIRSKYFVRASFSKLFRQYYQYGYWKVFVNRKHKTITSWRQMAPPVLVLSLIAGLLLFLFPPAGPILYCSGLGLYLLAAILFGLRASQKIMGFPLVVFSFLILHLSYGWGYLEGVLMGITGSKQPKAGSDKLSR